MPASFQPFVMRAEIDLRKKKKHRHINPETFFLKLEQPYRPASLRVARGQLLSVIRVAFSRTSMALPHTGVEAPTCEPTDAQRIQILIGFLPPPSGGCKSEVKWMFAKVPVAKADRLDFPWHYRSACRSPGFNKGSLFSQKKKKKI